MLALIDMSTAKHRRDAISMGEDEAWAFIGEQKSLQVGTLYKDGSIHLSTLWFGLKERQIVFETYTKSQKILNLKRDPRISLLLEDGDTYEKLRGVMITGTAELYDDPAEVKGLATLVLSRNNPLTDEQAEQAAEMIASKRTAVVVKADKIVSWDHTKLGGRY